MREFFTGLAIVAIVVLTTALVAPYFVDWNGQRAFLEAQLTRAMGQTVTIGGNIDLKLLPTPYIRLTQTVVGSDDGPLRIGIHHLDLELAVAPLLHGEFDIVEGRFEAPTIRVTLLPDRSFPVFPAPALKADLRFERVVIVDGTLAIADPSSGHTLVLDHLDLKGDASSVAGPFKVAGTIGQGGAQSKIRLTTTEARAGKTHLHFTMDETAAHPSLDLDGQFSYAPASSHAVRQSFEGKAVAGGHVKGPSNDRVPWQASGTLKLGAKDAIVDAGEIRIGDETTPLRLTASGGATFGETPKADLILSADQLDIDRLAGPPVDGKAPSPPQVPDLADVRASLAALTPPIATTVDIDVATALWGNEPLRNLKASVTLGNAKASPLTLSGDGPGGAHVALDGQAQGADFTGTGALSATDLPLALRWLGRIAPAARIHSRDVPFRAVAVKGRLAVTPRGMAATALDLTLDQSELSGMARLDVGRPQEKPRLTLDLTAKRLDLDDVPSLALLRAPAAPFDLNFRLKTDALQVSGLGRDGRGPGIGTGRLVVDLTRTDSRLDLKTFHAEDLGGATVDAHASRDDTGATLSLALDAPRVDGVAALSKRLLPSAISDALAARAASLSPAHLTLDATFRASDAGGLDPVSATAKGSFAGTALDANLTRPGGAASAAVITASAQTKNGTALLHQLGAATLPVDTIGAGRIDANARGRLDQPLDMHVDAALGATRLSLGGRFGLGRDSRGGSGTLKVTSPDVTPLLQGLAVAFPDLTGRLPADLTGGVAASEVGFGLSDLRGRLGATTVSGTIKWQTASGDAPALTGAIDLDTLSLAALGSLALGPGSEAGRGATWSDAPFTAGLVDPPKTAVTIHAGTLDLGFGAIGRDAALDLGLSPNTLSIERLEASIGGGHITGDATLRRDGPQASLEGKLETAGVTLDLPDLSSTVSGHLAFAASGRSPLALVGSLAGSGSARLTAARAARADPAALASIFADLENDTLAVDEETIKRAFHDRARTEADLGAREGDVTLAGGTMVFTPKPTSGDALSPAVDGRVEATLDLKTLAASLRLTETLHALPKDWAGPPPSVVALTDGRLPTHAVAQPDWNVSGLIDAVAARAIARESARIEAYEFDIRERAFFNERLETDRRRDLDRAKAEADAKAAADAARRAAEAAKKAEAERRAQAAKAAEARKAAAEAERRREAEPKASASEPSSPPPTSEPAPQPYDLPQGNPAADPSAAGRY